MTFHQPLTEGLRGALRGIQDSCLEQKAISHQTHESIETVRNSISREAAETRCTVKTAAYTAALDSSRLLQICAGLRVGVQRLEWRAQLAGRSYRKNQRLVVRNYQNMSAAMGTIAANLQIRASKTIILVEELLRWYVHPQHIL